MQQLSSWRSVSCLCSQNRDWQSQILQCMSTAAVRHDEQTDVLALHDISGNCALFCILPALAAS